MPPTKSQAMARYGKHPVVNKWFEWGETSDPSQEPLAISGAQEIALQDIIDSALSTARSEGLAQAAEIGRKHLATYSDNKIACAGHIIEEIEKAIPAPAFTQKIEDAAYERAANVMCGMCQKVSEKPESILVGSAKLLDGWWVHRWKGTGEFAGHCSAHLIRALKSQQESKEGL